MGNASWRRARRVHSILRWLRVLLAAGALPRQSLASLSYRRVTNKNKDRSKSLPSWDCRSKSITEYLSEMSGFYRLGTRRQAPVAVMTRIARGNFTMVGKASLSVLDDKGGHFDLHPSDIPTTEKNEGCG